MKKRMMNVLLAGVLAAGSISPAMAAMAEEADGKVLDCTERRYLHNGCYGDEQGLHGSDECI